MVGEQPQLRARLYLCAKEGSAPDECEDAARIAPDGLRYALSDGVTRASFSNLWAEGLVARFSDAALPHVASPDASDEDLWGWLMPVKHAWEREMAERWDGLPYHAQHRVRQGTAATLLGLVFAEPAAANGRPLPWLAVAIGDTCLFHVRGERLCRSFPLTSAGQFNNSPPLLYSKRFRNEGLRVARAEGECLPGDLILLATDALAQWILDSAEAGDRPWRQLCALGGQAEFTDLVTRLRRAGELKDDDTTLVIINYGAAPAQSPTDATPDTATPTKPEPVEPHAPTEPDAPGQLPVSPPPLEGPRGCLTRLLRPLLLLRHLLGRRP